MKIDPADTVQIVARWGEIPTGSRAVYANQEWIVAPVTLEIAELVPDNHIPLKPIAAQQPYSNLQTAIKKLPADIRKRGKDEWETITDLAKWVELEYQNTLLALSELTRPVLERSAMNLVVYAPLDKVWAGHWNGNYNILIAFLIHRRTLLKI